MSAARRLLLAAAGSGGGFIVPVAATKYALFNGQNGSNSYAIGAATSTDYGVTWTEYGSNPVLSKGSGGSWDDDHVKDPWLMWDGSQYVMYYSGHNGSSYQIGRATAASHEGPWTKDASNPVLALGSGGSFDDAGLAFPTVLREPSDTGHEWKMWYRSDDGSTQKIAYAYSSDGVSWTKVGVVLDVGSGGTWDDVGVLPGAVVKRAGTYYLFYGGRQSSVAPAKWQGGLATFTDPEGTYTKDAGNPTLLARFNDSGVSLAPTADVSNGDTTVQLVSSAVYNEGEPIAIADGDTTAHIGYIDSIDSSVQVTLDRAVVGDFTGGGKVFRPFAFNSVTPRSVLAAPSGWSMWGATFQPVDDLTQPASKLWEGSFRWTASALDDTWAYAYVSGQGLLFPLVTGASWRTRSAENLSVIAKP